MSAPEAEPTLRNGAVDAARARMLAVIEPCAAERVALSDAHGRILADDLLALRDQPPFRASAMDGYALRSADTPGNLHVVGEAKAGAGAEITLQPGQSVRIFTGAPLPDGADTIAIQEEVIRAGETITAPATGEGQHVRARGLDFRKGDRLLHEGSTLDAIALALAGAAGEATLSVARRARVTIVTGGDEIVHPGTDPGPYQIYDSLSVAFAALVTQWGGAPRVLAPQRDDLAALTNAYHHAFADADLVVTIGGASVGDRDLMKPALAPFSPQLCVEKIALRPGKPTWFAATSSCPVLGLPGNPASALVCAHLFLRPILARLHGKTDEPVAFTSARLCTPLPANGAREHYLRARLAVDGAGQNEVTPWEQQDSSLLSLFNRANALIRLPPHSPALEAGALVELLDLKR
jgi:molybdopterin molybdotransferase